MHGRSPLLRLQSDERLIAMVRRGNHHAFEALVARYQSRLLAFCRHMLTSKEDAEDVLQEVFAAAFNAILADEREINVRPWLYRIARNRSLNHLRRQQAIGVDSMDVHFADHGKTTVEHVQGREAIRELLEDVKTLPETQRTALLLREIDALSYEQISEAMETTVPSVKSLLVRARVSLAEAAEARLLTCAEVRLELGQVAEGLTRTTAPVRRHLRGCDRCRTFRGELRKTNRALAAVYPLGPLVLFKKLWLAKAGMGGAGAAGAAASGGAAAGSGGVAGVAMTAAGGITASGAVSAGVSTIASKAAAGVAAALIVTAGAVEVKNVRERQVTPPAQAALAPSPAPAAPAAHAPKVKAAARRVEAPAPAPEPAELQPAPAPVAPAPAPPAVVEQPPPAPPVQEEGSTVTVPPRAEDPPEPATPPGEPTEPGQQQPTEPGSGTGDTPPPAPPAGEPGGTSDPPPPPPAP